MKKSRWTVILTAGIAVAAVILFCWHYSLNRNAAVLNRYLQIELGDLVGKRLQVGVMQQARIHDRSRLSVFWNGRALKPSDGVRFTASDASMVKITEMKDEWELEGMAVGDVTLYVTYEGMKKAVPLTFFGDDTALLVNLENRMPVNAGQQLTITCRGKTLRPSDGVRFTATDASMVNIAELNGNWELKGTKEGEVTLYVSYDGMKKAVPLTFYDDGTALHVILPDKVPVRERQQLVIMSYGQRLKPSDGVRFTASDASMINITELKDSWELEGTRDGDVTLYVSYDGMKKAVPLSFYEDDKAIWVDLPGKAVANTRQRFTISYYARQLKPSRSVRFTASDASMVSITEREDCWELEGKKAGEVTLYISYDGHKKAVPLYFYEDDPALTVNLSNRALLYARESLTITFDGKKLKPGDGVSVYASTKAMEPMVRISEDNQEWTVRGWIPGEVTLTVVYDGHMEQVPMKIYVDSLTVECDDRIKVGKKVPLTLKVGDTTVVPGANGLTILDQSGNSASLTAGKSCFYVTGSRAGNTTFRFRLYGAEATVSIRVY